MHETRAPVVKGTHSETKGESLDTAADGEHNRLDLTQQYCSGHKSVKTLK